MDGVPSQNGLVGGEGVFCFGKNWEWEGGLECVINCWVYVWMRVWM
jgi:hypothetical protein